MIDVAILSVIRRWHFREGISIREISRRTDLVFDNEMSAGIIVCGWPGVGMRLGGVVGLLSGYAGGKTEKPTYRDVCSGDTQHAEVVQVEFDPLEISYDQLLNTFWAEHDPTQVNRQGPDVGEQYRSVIFYHTPEQQALAEASKAALEKSGKYSTPIATKIEPSPPFWKAEDYHQQYLEKRGMASCRIP